MLVECPNCEKKYKVPERHIGKKFRCENCGHRVRTGPSQEFREPNSRTSRQNGAIEVVEVTVSSPQAANESQFPNRLHSFVRYFAPIQVQKIQVGKLA